MMPNPRSLILNLLLATDSQCLSAREAVASCALFGISENSVRVTLARLAAAGLIASAGRGRYRLGPNATGLASDIATWRTAEARVCDWQGAWVGVYAGALGRSDRVALRARDRALALLGLRELERGLFVRPDNLSGGVAGVRERLYRLGLEPAAAVFALQALDAEREARARQLWDGDSLSRGYRDSRQQLTGWLRRADQLAPDVAARESFLLGNDAIRQLVFDPLLPDPLVDTEARRLFGETVRQFDAAGHAIWRRLHLVAASAAQPRPLPAATQ